MSTEKSSRRNKGIMQAPRKALAALLAVNLAVMMAPPTTSLAEEVAAPGNGLVEYDNPSWHDSGLDSWHDFNYPQGATAQEGPVQEGPGGPPAPGQAPAPHSAEGIPVMPLTITGIGDIPGGVEVDTWADFCIAWDDPNVSYIRLSSNVIRGTNNTQPSVLARDLVLDGNGHTLHVGSQNENITLVLTMTPGPDLSFTLKDIKIMRTTARSAQQNVLVAVGSRTTSAGTNATGFATWGYSSPGVPLPSTITDRWTVNLEDVEGDGPQRGSLVHNLNGTVRGTGKIVWYGQLNNTNNMPAPNAASGNHGPMVYAQHQVYDNADMDIRTSAPTGVLVASTLTGDNEISFINGTKAYLQNYRLDYYCAAVAIGTSWDRVHYQGSTSLNTNSKTSPEYAQKQATGAWMLVDGEGTEVTAYSNIWGWADESGTISTCGGHGGTTVSNGAKLSAYNTQTSSGQGGTALIQGIRGLKPGDAYFHVSGTGSKLYCESQNMLLNRESLMHGALWIHAGIGTYATVGLGLNEPMNCEMRVSRNAEVEVVRKLSNTNYNATAAGISFCGRDNKFFIESGGILKVVNEGNNGGAGNKDFETTIKSPAINFMGPNWSFDVHDYGSSIELYSQRGACISGTSTNAATTISNDNGTVNIGPGAVAIMHGSVDRGAIVHGTQGFEFTFTNPLYYDFANFGAGTTALPARVFRTTTATGVSFNSIDSDIAVWGNGTSRVGGTANASNSSINPQGTGTGTSAGLVPPPPVWGSSASWGDPYLSWPMQRLTIAGSVSFGGDGTFDNNNSLILTTAVDNFGSQGMLPYRRIQGNNAAPRIDRVFEPVTNADKYLRVIGSVAEGLDSLGRPIWTDEVFGRYAITRAATGDIEMSTAGQVSSILMENDVYEMEKTGRMLEGVVRYSDGGFLRSGDTFRMDSLWRGVEYPGNPDPAKVHLARPEDMPAPITVEDVLPPAPAKIGYPTSGKLWVGLEAELSGTWLAQGAQAAAEPHNPEPAIRLYAVVDTDDNAILGKDGQPILGTLNDDGTWDLVLPESATSTLSESSRVYLVLEDENGNANPVVASQQLVAIHDTYKQPAPYLEVKLPDLVLTHENAYIGLARAAEIAAYSTGSTEQGNELLGEIKASASVRPGAAWPGSTGLSVVEAVPPWGEPGYYLDRAAFSMAHPQGEDYRVRYAATADPGIYSTGHITVLPFMEARPYIGANDFSITAKNAASLMAGPSGECNDTLIMMAGAKARADLGDAFSPDMVEVHVVGIPADPVAGQSYPVTFKVLGSGASPDEGRWVTVQAIVVEGELPVLMVGSPVLVWLGDAARKPASAILPGAYNPADYVTALSAENGLDITGLVAIDASAVDLAKVGVYPVVYSVANADGNATTATGVVAVGTFVSDGNYLLDATSFVKKAADVDAGATAVVGDSRARAWLVDAAEPGGMVAVGVALKSAGSYRPGCAEGAYPVTLGVAAPAGGPATTLESTVDAVVTGCHELADKDDAGSAVRYSIAADNATISVADAADYAGMGNAAQLKLVNRSQAQAWQLMDTATALGLPGGALASLGDAGAVVVKNDIPAAGGISGRDYEVVFAIKGFEDITVAVAYTLYGTPPVITFQQDPLIIPFDRGETAHELTADEVRGQMLAWDDQDGDITAQATYTVNGGAVTSLHTATPGVYSVTYSVTDSDGMAAENATRALVIDDGSFMVDTAAGIILGAKGFLVAYGDVRGSEAEVLELSQASAYYLGDANHAAGTPVPAGMLQVAGFAASGYGRDALPGDYRFDIAVAGFDSAKPIVGRVLPEGASGGNGDLYAITAKDFRINITDALALQGAAGTADYARSFLVRAEATSYQRADAGLAPGGTPALADDGGFAAAAFLAEGAPGYPTVVPVKFWVDEDRDAFAWIGVAVSNGNHPAIHLPPIRTVWTGDAAAQPAGTVLASAWDYVWGPERTAADSVSATDSEDGDVTHLLAWGSLDGSGGFVEAASPLDFTRAGFQEVAYSVTDSDHNTVVRATKVLVNDGRYAVDGDYAVEALDFVVLAKDVAGTDAEVLAASRAHAWRIATGSHAEEALLPIPVDYLLAVADKAGYSKAPGAYAPIVVGLASAEPLYGGSPARSVTGLVVDGDDIGEGTDGTARYVVAASNATLALAEASGFAGLGNSAKALLIDRARAASWAVAATMEDWGVDVLSNEVGDAAHPVKAGGAYEVVFTPQGQPQVQAHVTFQIDQGLAPVIEFTEDPLVFEQTAAPVPLTDADLKRAMSVVDAEDGPLLDGTAVAVAGNVALDRHNVGVWRVAYSVTDSDGNTAAKSRAVVVTDGRYLIDKENDIIIGARDFVVKRFGVGCVDGSEGQAKSLSYAEAFDLSGAPLSVSWTGTPAGYAANAPAGSYPVSWKAEGRTTTKDVTARVVDADVVDMGTKDSSYAIAASHFRANLAEAYQILMGSPASYVDAASARVIPLVPDAAALDALLVTSGGFTDELGVYAVTFRIDTIPATTQSVTVEGTVSQGSVPLLDVMTPVEVWIGEPGLKPAAAITAAEYAAVAGDLYGVAAADDEDGDLISAVVASPDASTGPVDLARVGRYMVSYRVTDRDNNTVDRDRVVVVNDGRYAVGGRILAANSFVTLLKDVVPPFDQDILSKSAAALYDGQSGGRISSTAISVYASGNYRAEAGSYPIIVRGQDAPSGYLDRAITGEVVDAGTIASGPNDPDKDSFYVFGNDITLRIGEAEDILAAGDPAAALLEALGAGVRKATPTGSLSTLPATLASDGGFMAARGTYSAVVADSEGTVSIALTIQVSEGAPPWVRAEPKPLNIPFDPHTAGTVTREQLMSGVTAGDTEDGPLTGEVRINPDADGAEQMPVIPLKAFSVTQVTYSVTDSDNNTSFDTRAVIVNDGSAVYTPDYILQASSFVIPSRDVAAARDIDELILDRSAARAWTSQGEPATAVVADSVSMSAAARDYHLTIAIKENAALTKTITAKVLAEGASGGNGDLYAITAKDFRINITDALALQGAAGTADYARSFLVRAEATSYQRADAGLAPGGTPALADDGGFAAAAFLAEGAPGYPTVVPVKFWVDEDRDAFAWIGVAVSNGNHPAIHLPPIRTVWTGDAAAQPAGTVLASAWDYVWGPERTAADSVSATDSEDGDVTHLLAWGSLDGSGGFVEAASPLDFTRAGFQEVAYSVTDSDHNTVVRATKVLVNDGRYAVDGDYAVEALDFVVLAKDVAGTDAEVLAASRAHAWRIATGSHAEEALLPIPVDYLLAVADKAGYSKAPGAYAPIVVGLASAEPLYGGSPARSVTGLVVDGDDIGEGTDGTARYVVAASNATLALAEASGFAGLGNSAKALLIDRARAASWAVAATMEDWGVDVLSNEVGDAAHPVKAGGAYEVVFTPQGQPQVQAHVTFQIDQGLAPVIEFTEDPLVFEQTAAPVPLTDADLKRAMSVVDAEDGPLLDGTAVAVAGNVALDRHNVGVWRVAYSVTDSDGNTAAKSRAVVVTDGRYLIDKENDIIIGARDFVARSADIEGSEGQARSLSYAEAFTFAGERLTVNWAGAPAGYTAAAAAGDYPITWRVSGRPAATTVTAHVTDADIVDPGGKDANYAIAASSFTVNLVDAQAILEGAPQGFIDAAKVRVIGLVADMPERTPLLVNTANFRAALGSYTPITFRIDGIDLAEQGVAVTGTVSQGGMPTITVPTPLEVWVGDAASRPVGSLLAGEYHAMHGVSAVDDEDGVITGWVTYEADPATGDVDVAKVGMYRLTYDVIDTDFNHPRVLPTRVVIVNDGRYVPGNGRVLRASSFVTRLVDVTTNPANLNSEILGKSGAALYNGETGFPMSSTELSVQSAGGYGPAAGTYRITVRGQDAPAGFITKDVTGTVLDAGVLGSGPDDPDRDNYYVYGDHIMLRYSEAQAILDAPDVDKALLAALGAGGLKTTPEGAVEPFDPTVLSRGGFTAATGTYSVTVAEPANQASIVLRVQVGEGSMPTIAAVPTPLEVAWSPTAAGSLSRAQLMAGVTAHDEDDGNITGWVVINPDASGAEVLPAIPLNAASVTRVTYAVTDSDGNRVSVDRAVVVNDGSIDYTPEFILKASSFAIKASDVAQPYESQILALSGALAWRSDGTPTAMRVADVAGYKDVAADYAPIIGIVASPNLTRTVTAKVLPEGTEVGNGATYAISARHFRINLADARVLQAQSGTAYGSAFVSRANAQSYLRADQGLSLGGTPALADDGGFKTASFLAEGAAGYPTVIPATFWVNEDHTASVQVNVTVSNGHHPWITVPELRQAGLNSSFTEADYWGGVAYGDAEDGNAAPPLALSRTGAVDTSTEGVYKLGYTVTDTEGNSTSAVGYVLVGDWAFSGDWAVKAWSFVTTADEVRAASPLDSLILGLGKADAVRLVRDAQGMVTGIEHVAPSVKDRAGLGPQEGSYGPVVIGVPGGMQEAASTPLPTKDIRAQVLDRKAISNTPDEDGTVHDANTADPADTNRYIVAANHVPLTWAQAGSLANRDDMVAKATLATLAAARGFKVTPAGSLSDHGVDVSFNGIRQAMGAYDVTFVPQGVGGVSVTVSFTVDRGTMPVITLDGPLVLAATSTPVTLTRDQLLRGVGVVDAESPELGLKDVVITGASGTGAMPLIDSSKAGVYQVVYTVADPFITNPDGTPATTSAARAVIIDDGSFFYGKDYVLAARDFTIDYAEVDLADKSGQIAAKSGAQAASYDGTPATVAVSSNGYTNVAGQYRPQIAVAADPTLKASITATVTAPLKRCAVTFDANGGYLTGPATIYVQEPAATLSYLPSSPIRSGYTFTHWAAAPGGGLQFLASTPVVSDMAVYAQWEKNADPPAPEPQQPPTVIVNPPSVVVNPPTVNIPPSGGSNSTPPTTIPVYVTVPAAPASEAPAAAAGSADDADDREGEADGRDPDRDSAPDSGPDPVAYGPTAKAAGGSTPSGDSPQSTWSLFNLVAAVLSGALLLLTLAGFLRGRRSRASEYHEEPIDKDAWAEMTPEQRVALMVKREKSRNAWEQGRAGKAGSRPGKAGTRGAGGGIGLSANTPVLLISAVAFVEGLVILLTTQDFAGPMAATDNYSIPLSLLVLAQLVVPLIAAMLKRDPTTALGSAPS
ncbi:MAG: InlB B-repeat-containing protein [Eggerthellaceae bacterium]|nr:InlB B-repeat-containing protein [Eggerthellaceae bacterium]